MKGGSKVVVEAHRHAGVFIAHGKEDALCTKNMVPGEAVYNEKRISVQVVFSKRVLRAILSNEIGYLCQDLSYLFRVLVLWMKLIFIDPMVFVWAYGNWLNIMNMLWNEALR